MQKLELIILLKLVLAHLLADFVLQTKKWIDDRKTKKLKSAYFYLHIGVAAILSYLFVAQWEMWWLIPLVYITHFLIDLWKIKQSVETTKIFVIDQLIHFITLFSIWLFITQNQEVITSQMRDIWNNQNVIIFTVGYVLILWPSGIFIREFTSKWRTQLQFTAIAELDKAGMWIGYFERFLVLTLILLSQYEVIGFLIAAKSILRLNSTEEGRSRQYTEYVLVGTFVSLCITISIGLMIKFLTIAP
jgi:hypothetical protein